MDGFFKDFFGVEDDDNDPVLRNKGCRFTDNVLNYLLYEWEIEVMDYPDDIKNRVMDEIERGVKEGNVPNTAAQIAMSIIPI